MNRTVAVVGVAVAGAVALASGCEDKKPSKPAATAAGSSQPAANDQDAAPMYEAVWAKLPGDVADAAAGLSITAEGKAEMRPESGVMWDELAAMLQREKQTISELIAAAGAGRCDFGVSEAARAPAKLDKALAIGGEFRKAARVLRADAMRAWLAGDGEGAAARLEAMYRLAGHTGQQKVVLLSLVSAALIELTNESAKTMATTATPLTRAQRERVLAALNALDATDPSGMIEARKNEVELDPQGGQRLDQGLARLTQSIARTRAALKGE